MKKKHATCLITKKDLIEQSSPKKTKMLYDMMHHENYEVSPLVSWSNVRYGQICAKIHVHHFRAVNFC